MTAFIDSLIMIEDIEEPAKLEVICQPQEGRYYYATTFTEEIGKGNETRYYTTNLLTYMGRYTGGRIEGWGNDMKEWSHFINDEGEEVIIKHSKLTAFYHIKHIPVVRPTKTKLDQLPTFRLPKPISTKLLLLKKVGQNTTCKL